MAALPVRPKKVSPISIVRKVSTPNSQVELMVDPSCACTLVDRRSWPSPSHATDVIAARPRDLSSRPCVVAAETEQELGHQHRAAEDGAEQKERFHVSPALVQDTCDFLPVIRRRSAKLEENPPVSSGTKGGLSNFAALRLSRKKPAGATLRHTANFDPDCWSRRAAGYAGPEGLADLGQACRARDTLWQASAFASGQSTNCCSSGIEVQPATRSGSRSRPDAPSDNCDGPLRAVHSWACACGPRVKKLAPCARHSRAGRGVLCLRSGPVCSSDPGTR